MLVLDFDIGPLESATFSDEHSLLIGLWVKTLPLSY